MCIDNKRLEHLINKLGVVIALEEARVEVSKLKNRPDWIASAKQYNLILNAWTANSSEDIDWLLANEFDYITTDEPELVFEKIK